MPWISVGCAVRTNEQDCLELTKKIIKEPLSTRELVQLYKHYGKSNRTIRDRIIASPALFIKTMKEQDEKKLGKQLNDGPEGKWFRNISIVCHMLKRLKATSEDVLYPNQQGTIHLSPCFPKLSIRGKGKLHYETAIDNDSGNTLLRISGNDTGGTFSMEWISLTDINATIDCKNEEGESFNANIVTKLLN